MNGHPQAEATRVAERYRLRDFGHIHLQLIVNDPTAYTKPWREGAAPLGSGRGAD
jgi:hypothetical protein